MRGVRAARTVSCGHCGAWGHKRAEVLRLLAVERRALREGQKR